ncbi:MAG: hypothetical protein MSR67_03450 [Oscillospiraceae bacterium]|nr:hypothetical protein [Oscillospiraceae bacterium]
MPKKITLVSAAALVLFIILIVILINVTAENPSSPFPENVTVYLKERSEIVTLDYGGFLEGCLRGFLPENGELYEPQTLEALAVVVNTNALYTLQNRDKFENYGADFSTGELFPYTEKAVNSTARARIGTAADAAAEKFLALDGKPVLLDFCRISSGKTIPKLPAMPSVNLPSDALSKGFLSKNAYTVNEVRALSEIKRLREPPEEWFSEPVYDEYGTLLSVKICGQKITGEFIKNTLGLRSAAIEIGFEDDCFVFICKGWGNNTGMSLAAADTLSRDGKSYDEILAVFYNAALQNAR